jgi:Cu+-exporting ATPase
MRQDRYDGMSCAACAVRLEKVLNRLPGVDAKVNFATGKAAFRSGRRGARRHSGAIRKAGFDVAPRCSSSALPA